MDGGYKHLFGIVLHITSPGRSEVAHSAVDFIYTVNFILKKRWAILDAPCYMLLPRPFFYFQAKHDVELESLKFILCFQMALFDSKLIKLKCSMSIYATYIVRFHIILLPQFAFGCQKKMRLYKKLCK